MAEERKDESASTPNASKLLFAILRAKVAIDQTNERQETVLHILARVIKPENEDLVSAVSHVIVVCKADTHRNTSRFTLCIVIMQDFD